MLKKTITYDNHDGESVTRDFYFNISRAEFMELELSADPSFSQVMDQIIKSKDRLALLQGMKKIISWAYGEKIGDDFIKDEVKGRAFASTEAYSQLLIDLCNDAGAAAEFVMGIAPKGLVKESEVLKQFENVELPADPTVETDGQSSVENSASVPSVPTTSEVPAWIAEDREPTDKELIEMPKDQLLEAMRRKNARHAAPSE